MAKYCLPPDPLLLRGTHPDLLYLEDAWWRERGIAALKINFDIDIRTGSEGAQLRVWVRW